MIADYVAQARLDVSNALKNLNKIDSTVKYSLFRAERGFSQLSERTRGFSIASAVAFGAGAAFLKSAADEASDLEESINAVNVVFGNGANKILEFSNIAVEQTGLARSEFNQLSSQTGALLARTGRPLDEVAESTIEVAKRAADLASVFNTDVTDALSAINQAIRGETEAIRRYAGDVTDATLKNFLFSKGIDKNIKDLTQEEKTLLRLRVILEQTDKVQGDFVKTSEGLANQQRLLSKGFKDLKADIGREVLPIALKLVKTANMLVKNFRSLSDEQKKVISQFLIFGTAAAGLGAVLSPLLFTLSKLAGGVSLLLGGVGKLRLALIAVSNPVTAVLSAFGLLVALFKDDLKPQLDKIKLSFAGFKDTVQPAIDSITTSFGLLSDQLRPLIELLKNSLVEALGGVLEILADVLKGFGELIGLLDRAGKFLGEGAARLVVGDIKDNLSTLPQPGTLEFERLRALEIGNRTGVPGLIPDSKPINQTNNITFQTSGNIAQDANIAVGTLQTQLAGQ